ncbi:MAG: cytochrome P460 family protein [Planctomycetaceae bacterium]|nr:cytochrome P460 family protein [Planctomycetaceae bacterium]
MMKQLRVRILSVAIIASAAAASVMPLNSLFAQSGTRTVPQGSMQGSGTSQVQSSNRIQSSSPTQMAQPRASFEERLWDWLQKSQYRNWAPPAGQSGEAIPGENPHGALVKLYANRTAVANAETLPNGSVIIKENFGPDGTTLMAVTLMYRTQGFDPEHGDWYWAKYEADGRVSQMNGMPIAGKVGMCIECHGSAEGNDYSFTNDR